MTKLLVTGASGLLGLNLALTAVEQGYQVTGWSGNRALQGVPFAAEQVDLDNLEAIPARLQSAAPDLLVHCAALADIDQAEREPNLAHRINAVVPGVLAENAARLGIKMIHISTDAVFDGERGDYRETDTPNPKNVYAQTKLAGEQLVAQANPDAIIARVNFYGWSASGNRSLAEFFYNHLIAQQTVNGFTDVYFTPLYVGHLAQTLLQMGQADLNGLYHVFGAESISKYVFGVSLARQFELDESLVSPISVEESGLTALRSPNLSMNTEKLHNALGISPVGLFGGLQAFHAAWQAGLPARLQSFIA